MKALLFSIVFLFIYQTNFAQQQKRPGYVASKYTYKFEKSKLNLPMQGYYILNDGTEVKAIIAYAKPEFFIGDFAPASSLYICKSLTDKAVNIFNPDDPNHKEYIKKDQIKAFYINGHLYGNLPNVGWRIILTEGAIHTYLDVKKVEIGNNISYPSFKYTQWLDGYSSGTLMGGISNEELLKMLKKTPPNVRAGASPQSIVDGYEAKEYAIYEAENKYNFWYDENSEAAIDYILGVDGLTHDISVQKEKEIADRQAQEQADKEAAENMRLQQEAGQNATQAAKQDRFKGRTTTVSSEFASAKPEVKVKKQKFKGRIDRIKADGNKIGVVVDCSNITVNPSAQTFFSSQKKQTVRGSYKPLEGIQTVADQVVEELNKGFDTDIFEVVDLKNIPYRINNLGKKEDDWWSTKYKIVIFYRYNPYYTAFVQTTTNEAGTKSEFKAQMVVSTSAYMMAAEDGGKKMKSAGNPPKVAENYKSAFYVADSSTKIWTIQELKALLTTKTDAEIVEEIKAQQMKGLAKFIKKHNK